MKKLQILAAISLLTGMQLMSMDSEIQEKQKALTTAIVNSAKFQCEELGLRAFSHAIAPSEGITYENLAHAFIQASTKPKFQRAAQNFNINTEIIGGSIVLHYQPKDNSAR